MKRILVTGATGNIGLEVVHYLKELEPGCEVIAAVRDVDKAKAYFEAYTNLHLRKFDFEDTSTFPAAFHQIDVLFLLRPPHISDVERFFRPLLITAKENGVKNIIFLSVQGAEKSNVIPHRKIENIILELGFNYIFVRPSYFMQNLTTTLLPEIVDKQTITLPSGHAKFNWIDVKNIGKATAQLILNFEKYQNQPYQITGSENKDFYEVAALLSDITGERIRFRSVNPISFYFRKRKEGIASSFAVVMTILHFLPRIQSEPEITDDYQRLTGTLPTTLHEFIQRENEMFAAEQSK